MAAPRATTIQQRFGFKDSDLKTPRHDEIMLWLDQNAQRVVESLVIDEWSDSRLETVKCRIEGWTADQLPPRTPMKVVKTKWESPIADGKYIIGFIDMAVRYEMDEVYSTRGRSWEPWEWGIERSNHGILFEVKVTIPSLGELLRQIRMYQKYTHTPFVVISPDDRFADILKEQGVGFRLCP